ncbi:MAG: hypothetical protein US11_C0002G0002 [Candidatus Roizmanbacteria bacterium GW2011_GWA2_36_23]|uniref:Polymerase nucleotidyl transferase domain-containing protein n=1 Tax=Candidatus Roizmanbacteria bacterium GW2011_GWA2_36_23 TaxID=1618480 RepID=A0A0G0E4X4_9BACT|nr:MAG: hypothetical protein US11_C0002G0002 [Candidatus Roizmanbacteria bacterium GW2011_GWA2_36_23]
MFDPENPLVKQASDIGYNVRAIPQALFGLQSILPQKIIETDLQPSQCLDHAFQQMKQHGVGNDTMNFYKDVTLPIVFALHNNHPRNGYIKTAEGILDEVLDAKPERRLELIEKITQDAIEFVRKRENIGRRFRSFLTNELKYKELRRLKVPVIAMIGSFVRGDAHLFSDFDLMLFSENPLILPDGISNGDLDKFEERLANFLYVLNPYARSLNIIKQRSLYIFGFNDLFSSRLISETFDLQSCNLSFELIGSNKEVLQRIGLILSGTI